MAKITSVRYYRVKPRWLMVKIVDENGQHGWGEATLEGHDLAVEGCLEEMIPRIIGNEAKYVRPSAICCLPGLGPQRESEPLPLLRVP